MKSNISSLDDVIHNFVIFSTFFDYESVSAHMIKITRDAQLDIDSDLSKSMIEKILSVKTDRE
jgi:polyphosphate kinase